jgi:RNA polymerase sigma-70 factor (ECF subfamily)
MAIRVDEIEVSGRGAVDLDRDRILVLRHQGGERHAFEELYRRYHRRLVAYCERRVGDRHVAEELAQEAFIRALRALPTFGGERRFYPWLVVIAQRLCIDHHRRNGRVEPAAEVDTGAVDADHDALWASVDHHHLAVAIERLAPRHREVLGLREQRGWSYQQLASHLDVPVTTVEALLHRARKALRREYAAVAGEDAGRLAAFGGLAALLVRSKSWLAALRAEQVAPAVAAATFAGVAVLGFTAVPDPGPAAPDAPVDVSTASPASADLAPAPGTGADAANPASGAPVMTAPAPTTTSPTARPAGRPTPALEVGPVAVFADEEGQAYVDEAVEAMPVVVDLGVVRLGVDPADLLGLTVEPDDDTAPTDTAGAPG